MDFTLETITPVFMGGADPRQNELRPPSIKGAMRFWWRAMNGHLSLKELKKQEAKLFGDSGEHGRSKFVIRLKDVNKVKTAFISLTPHHREGYCDKNKRACFYRKEKCMKANLQKGIFYNFNLCLNCHQSDTMPLESLIKLFLISGGFGKRSRRGFGSVRIDKINDRVSDFDYSLCSILDLLNSVEKDSFRMESRRIIRNKPANQEAKYPYIKEIEIGRQSSAYEDILIKIGQCSHDYRDNSLGFAYGGKRFASPIYVSVIKTDNVYRPVITTLNTAIRGRESMNMKKQEKFKKAILS